MVWYLYSIWLFVGEGARCMTNSEKRDLRKRTREYWEKRPGYDYYIRNLLAEELQYADNSQHLHGVVNKVHTLAITVGESFEPLLQLVYVLRPRWMRS